MGILSYIKQRRSILFFGDIVLILAATELSTWVRLGQSIQVFERHSGASTFTLILYVAMLYIFDLYNVDRARFTKDVVVRLSVAVGSAGVVLAVIFYSLPNWVFGRGIFLIQMALVLLMLAGWRWLFTSAVSTPISRTDVLIIGAGRSGHALYSLLNTPESPYRPVGFVDDDPAKLGDTVGLTPVMGTTDQLIKIASRQKVDMAILAITHERPQTLVDRVIRARLNGLTIPDMPTIYEELTGSIPVEHLRNDWLLFADGFLLLAKQYVRRIKRLIDFASSTILLIVSAPVIVLTAIA
ncbi:MAG: hypothetical protein R6X27_02165, partial [Candidatus Desulfacyla sp.]